MMTTEFLIGLIATFTAMVSMIVGTIYATRDPARTFNGKCVLAVAAIPTFFMVILLCSGAVEERMKHSAIWNLQRDEGTLLGFYWATLFMCLLCILFTAVSHAARLVLNDALSILKIFVTGKGSGTKGKGESWLKKMGAEFQEGVEGGDTANWWKKTDSKDEDDENPPEPPKSRYN